MSADDETMRRIEEYTDQVAEGAPEIPAEVLADLADQLGIAWED